MSRTFLDRCQYSETSILRYEAVYGRNFISPGGAKVAARFTAGLGLRPGMRVLDIGCGLGGPAFQMVSGYGVRVHGIDLSANMIRIAGDRLLVTDLGDSVTLEHGDCLEHPGTGVYDVVHSRDVFLHIADKTRLFRVISRVLRAGGKLAFSDYCRGRANLSPEFEAYIRDRNYHLYSVAQYTNLLEQAGFQGLEGADRTAEFCSILEEELKCMESAPLSGKDRSSLRASWQAKLHRAERGEQGWGWFTARKPDLSPGGTPPWIMTGGKE